MPSACSDKGNAPDCLGEIRFRIVARLRKRVEEISHSWIMRLQFYE